MQIGHRLAFVRPALDGKRTEEESRSTPFHVGQFGKLTLMPDTQLEFLDRAGQPSADAAKSA